MDTSNPTTRPASPDFSWGWLGCVVSGGLGRWGVLEAAGRLETTPGRVGVAGGVGFGVLVGELNYGWGKLDGVAACSGDGGEGV